MPYPTQIFKAYDIRGLLEEVTPEIAQAVAKVFVHKMNAKTVVVGRDMRATSPELAKALIAGAQSAGANVVDIGMVTTSLFNFAVSSDDSIDAGFMVTASHNPAIWNGIKMALSNGLPVAGKEVLEWLQENEEVPLGEPGTVETRNYQDAYLNAVIERSAVAGVDLSGVKLVVDYGNGMGALTIHSLLERLGITAIELFAEPDANFPNHEANPAKFETLADLQARVLSEGADFGVALDGDGDRLAFVDNEGKIITGDLTLALIGAFLLKSEKGKVVGAPNQGWAVRDAIAAAGGEYIDTLIGRAFLIRAIANEGALLGGEISGHQMYRAMANLESIDFGLCTMLRLWKESGKTLADLVRPLRTFVSSGEVNAEAENKDEILKRITDHFVPLATSSNTMDGIRCDFSHDWWFIVRPSNTEPVLRITVEATSEELMKEKVAELVAFVTSSS